MKVSRRAALTGLLVAPLAALFVDRASAADWPDHALEWIVPFPPGGSNDIFARPVAAEVGERLGQAVVVTNRGGAGGTIGGRMAARAAPDGYTSLVVNPSLTFAPIVYPDSGFDLMRAFAPIALIARVPVALVVNPRKVHAKDLAGFLAAARKGPEEIDIGSSGLGTIPHMAIELLQQRTGVRLMHIPYRGGGIALQDPLSGQIDAMFSPLSTVAAYVQSGRLRALAVAAAKREPVLPDVPTFAQAGVADFEVSTWYGLAGPEGTPAGRLDTLHAAIEAALVEPDVKRIWAEQGAEGELMTRAEFTDFVRHEVARWSRIARTVNIPME